VCVCVGGGAAARGAGRLASKCVLHTRWRGGQRWRAAPGCGPRAHLHVLEQLPDHAHVAVRLVLDVPLLRAELDGVARAHCEPLAADLDVDGVEVQGGLRVVLRVLQRHPLQLGARHAGVAQQAVAVGVVGGGLGLQAASGPGGAALSWQLRA
jgi:hypothetical protein